MDKDALHTLLDKDIYRTCLSRVGQHPESSRRVWQMQGGFTWPPDRAEFRSRKLGSVARPSWAWWQKPICGVPRVLNPDKYPPVNIYIYIYKFPKLEKILSAHITGLIIYWLVPYFALQHYSLSFNLTVWIWLLFS
jgi:hypothetical protein